MNELTVTELADYKRLLAIVAETKESAGKFYDTLTEIHERKLYRQDYKTWEEFAEKELGLSARALTFKLKAHSVRKEIGSTASEISDRAALTLDIVKPKSRKRTLKKALEIANGKPVTPKHIAQANSSITRNYSEHRPDLSVYCSGPVTSPTVPTPKVNAADYANDFAPKPKPVIPPNLPSIGAKQLSRDERLLALLKEIEATCPCGARPESLNTHSHVLGCPVDLAIVLLTT